MGYGIGTLGALLGLTSTTLMGAAHSAAMKLARIQSGLGEEVTVTLHAKPDRDSTPFTLFAPQVQLGPNESTRVETLGVLTMHTTGFAPQMLHGRLDHFTVTA